MSARIALLLLLSLDASELTVRAQESDREYAGDISSIELTMLNLTPDLATALSNRLAVGSILMWSGLADRVPTGWALCNGANGTPNLQEQFVIGAATADETGRAGGQEDHSHSANSHQHTIRIPAHVHAIPGLEGFATGLDPGHDHETGPATGAVLVDDFGFGGEHVAASGHVHRLEWHHSHQHRLEVPRHWTTQIEGLGSTLGAVAPVRSSDHLPPYFTLCYIMKSPAEGKTGADKPALDLAGRIVAARDSLARLKSQLQWISSNGVPEGVVLLWSGSEPVVPNGWRLCNGLGGTPDLRSRLIIGASGALEAGQVGGTASHAHASRAHQHTVALPPHTHALVCSTFETEIAGEHRHSLGGCDGPLGDLRQFSGALVAPLVHSHTVSLSGGHCHELLFPERFPEVADGSGWCALTNLLLGASDHLPPHRKFRFLVKGKELPAAVSLNLAPVDAVSAVRMAAIEKALALVSIDLNAAATFAIPNGAIVAWAGEANALPGGWSACDGRDGTPDLRGRCIRGTTRQPGQIGGDSEHSHLLGPHQHSARFPHTHEIPVGTLRTRTDPTDGIGFDTRHFHYFNTLTASVPINVGQGGHAPVASSSHGHELLDDNPTRHEHDVSLQEIISPQSGSAAGPTSDTESSSLAAEHLPPYRKMLFIMKTGEPKLGSMVIQLPTVAPGQHALRLELTWPSLGGQHYTLEFTPRLGSTPFSSLVTNVTATPPLNSLQTEVRPPQGFYRLRLE
jgi:hypothetical protein